MKLTFKHTQVACWLGYVSQAITASFLPLLFVRMENEFGFSLAKLTFIITLTFVSEIIIDAISPFLVKLFGYRKTLVAGNFCSVIGIAGLSVFPSLFKDPYLGFMLCAFFYSIGGGVDEVLVSPVVEACPTKNKERAMGILHSAFCFGCAGVILFSTIYFHFFGIENWRILAIIWAVIPLVNSVLFAFVPIRTIEEEKGKGRFVDTLKNPLFWVLGVGMFCAGASELSISQWASAFAESGLGVSKTLGDLLGPCAFAILMGISRLTYAGLNHKFDIKKIMIFASVFGVVFYLVTVLATNPLIALIGCCLCGVAVAPLWPGTFSLAAKHIPNASTAMFAVYALLGDGGCTIGPSIVGFVSTANNDDISKGLACATIFPAMMIITILVTKKLTQKEEVKTKSVVVTE